MEKKKLQRVIGISVVVAFVIVLIPFLFGKKEMPQQETTAQITPEQQSATTIADTTQTTTTIDGTQATTVQDNSAQMNPTDAANSTNAPTPNTPTSNAEENGITPITNTAPVAATDPNATPVNPGDTTTTTTTTTQTNTNGETMSAVNPAATATNSPALTSNSDDSMQATPAVSTDTTDTTQAQVTAEKTAALAPVHEVKARHIHKKLAAKKVHHTLAKNVDTNKPAWVVQMGNFKDKTNANRMVSQLKSSGYKAFTRVVTAPSGTVRTRVYIGPESKQASAQQLTTKVQREMKLQGFVLPYKAIAL